MYFTRGLLNVAEIRFGVYFYTKSNSTGAISDFYKTLGKIGFTGQGGIKITWILNSNAQ